MQGSAGLSQDSARTQPGLSQDSVRLAGTLQGVSLPGVGQMIHPAISQHSVRTLSERGLSHDSIRTSQDFRTWPARLSQQPGHSQGSATTRPVTQPGNQPGTQPGQQGLSQDSVRTKPGLSARTKPRIRQEQKQTSRPTLRQGIDRR